MQMIIARYKGRCAGCHQSFRAGEEIGYGGKGRTFHRSCVPSPKVTVDRSRDTWSTGWILENWNSESMNSKPAGSRY